MVHPDLPNLDGTIESYQDDGNVPVEQAIATLRNSIEIENGNLADRIVDNFLRRRPGDRQTILEAIQDLPNRILDGEQDDNLQPMYDAFKSCIKCLARFPEAEKEFLIRVFENRRISDTIKFLAIEEVICSKNDQFLREFVNNDAENDIRLNQQLVETLDNNCILNNDAITEAVRNIMIHNLIDVDNIFPRDNSFYMLDGRSLKKTYIAAHCDQNDVTRLRVLHELLDYCNQKEHILMIVKIILSHCDFQLDLQSILDQGSLGDEDTLSSFELLNSNVLGNMVQYAFSPL